MNDGQSVPNIRRFLRILASVLKRPSRIEIDHFYIYTTGVYSKEEL